MIPSESLTTGQMIPSESLTTGQMIPSESLTTGQMISPGTHIIVHQQRYPHSDSTK
jgi:hypothetical protein